MENKTEVKALCNSHGCGINFKILTLHPTAMTNNKNKTKKTDTETHTNKHSTTRANSWRHGQTRRELISPTRRGLQGERERQRDGERWRIVFTRVWLSGLQAPHHSHSLLCHSQRHVSLYLPISPSINLHLPSSSLQGLVLSSSLLPAFISACTLSSVLGVSHLHRQQEDRQ